MIMRVGVSLYYLISSPLNVANEDVCGPLAWCVLPVPPVINLWTWHVNVEVAS